MMSDVRRRFACGLLLVTTGGLFQGVAVAAAPSLTFYVPFPEADALSAFNSINAAAVSPVTTYISIAAVADSTVIWYDHWEDGFEKAHHLNTPVQPTTEIWGDGNPANGFPPGFTNDLLRAGAVIMLGNEVNPSSPGTIDFDARDKIVASREIAVTRTYWAGTSSTLMAGSVETYDTSKWGTDYRVPVGQNIPDGSSANAGDHQMFEYTALSIMAAEDNTTVYLDADNNGVNETTVTLSEGGAYFVNGGLSVGGRVSSTKPVQVMMFTGDVGSNYETRDSTLLPVSLWSHSYYTPVSSPSGDGTRVWLYNPGTSSITVNYRVRAGSALAVTTNSVTVGTGTDAYASVLMTDGSGAEFFTTGSPAPVFYAYSTTDSDNATAGDNQAWDWSYTLVSKPLLTPQVLVGLGVGRDPLSTVNPSENGNPIWVTTVGNGQSNATVYVDFNGDNVGAYTDVYGNHYDTNFVARELQPLKIYDPDGNQTAMLVYTLSTNVLLAAAWGQDTTTATASAPGLDAGTAVPPVDVFDVSKVLALENDADGDGQLGPGERIAYEILLGNSSRAPIPADVIVWDALPEDTAYVAGSTSYRTATNGAWVAVDDDSSGTAFPLDGSGLRIRAAIPVGGGISVRFQVDVDAYAELAPGRHSIINTGTVTSVVYNRTLPFKNETYLHGSLGDRVWYDADGDGSQDAGEPGLNGVAVYLDYNANGVRDAGEFFAITAGDGDYLLTNALIEAGTHLVRVDRSTLPSALLAATYDLDGAVSADAAFVTVSAGQDRLDVDFGYRAVAQLSGSVFVDANGNGVAEAADTNGLFGVTVLLLDAASNTVASTTTSLAGFYEFLNVATGSYLVVQLLPSGYTNTFDIAGVNDRVIPRTLTTGQNSTGNNFYDARDGSVAAQGKVLYLSDPSQALDRVDPVATGDNTTTNTVTLSTGAGAGAITVVGAAAASSSAQTAASHSFTYNSGNTGVNRMLLVGISYRNSDSELVNSVTYGGQSLTLVGTDQRASGTPDGRIYIYKLLNPPLGNNTLQVTWSSALNNAAVVGALTLAGVNQASPTAAFASANNSSGTPAVTVSSAPGQLIFGVVSGRSTSAYTTTSGGTSLWSSMPVSGQTAASAQTKAGASPSVSLTWTGSSADWVAGGVSIIPAPSAESAATFTQAPAFALPFAMAAGATVSITGYVTVTSGTMPANPAVTARLSTGGSTFLTLSSPTYSGGALVWSGALGGAVSIAAGQAISLNVSNAQSGVEFQLRYDSATYPSKIILPTTSIIEIPSLTLYDAPYPGGVPVTFSPATTQVYVRVTATDPFGAGDVNRVALALDGPGAAGDLSVMLSNAYVVASNGWSKTYEYLWQTTAQTGTYSVVATAYEGTEGVTATKSTEHRLYAGSIGDRVFADFNNNGLWDPGEGIAGVTVTLQGDVDGDGDTDTFVTTSGADGYYLFEGLRASDAGVAYAVTVDTGDLPAGLTLNTVDPDGGGDSTSALALTVAAPVRLDQDFGYRSPAVYAISGQVRDDYDLDGTFSDPDQPVGGVLISLCSDPNRDGDPSDGAVLATLRSAPDGFYQFTNLIASAYVVVESDPVYSVSTADVVAANDNRIPVVIVNADVAGRDFLDAVDPSGYFYDVADGRIVPGGRVDVSGAGAWVLMDGGSGQYMFLSTNPVETVYTIAVTPPPGYAIDPTRPAQPGLFDPTGGADPTVLGSAESQTSPGYLSNYSAVSNVYYYTFRLAPGDPPVINNNFPLVKTVVIGDRVWHDLDGDGVQDLGEAGVTNVTVRLLDAASNVVATAVTDASGAYLFTNQPAASYQVEFVAPEPYAFSVRDAAAASDLEDSDADPATGRTAPVSVAGGTTNLTLDAGLYVPAVLFGYVFKDGNGSLVRDTGDGTITNVLVRLLVNGVSVASTNTDSVGYYRFENIPAGVASVLVSRADATLVAVPALPPASSDPMRNRGQALPGSGATDAYIAHPVVSGYGVLPGLPGEPLNFGFANYPLSTSIDFRVFSSGRGGVMIDVWTVNEAGRGDIVVFAWLDNAWVEVGRVPADDVFGEGSNKYRIRSTGLSSEGSYYFRIVDESGRVHDSLVPVGVKNIKLNALRFAMQTAELTFSTEHGRKYLVKVSDSLAAPDDGWAAESVSVQRGEGWAAFSDKPFMAGPGAQSVVRIPVSRQKAFFKVVEADE